MKKFICVLSCSLFALVLTGCGTKTLTCTKTSTDDGMETKENIKVNFKNDKPSTAEMNMKMSFDEDSKSYMGMFYGILESTFANYEQEGLTIETDKTDDEITVKMNVDFNKVESTDELDFDIEADEDFESVKEDLESDGYKCK